MLPMFQWLMMPPSIAAPQKMAHQVRIRISVTMVMSARPIITTILAVAFIRCL